MNDINLVHILQRGIKDLGRGVAVLRTNNVTPRTFVCHLDWQGALRYGFFYPNGSNGRLAYVVNGVVELGAVGGGEFVIGFQDVTTRHTINRNRFTGDAASVTQEWSNDEAMILVKQELDFLRNEDDVVRRLITHLQGLILAQAESVITYMEGL